MHLNQKRLKENAKKLKMEKQLQLEDQMEKFNELISLSKYIKEDQFLIIDNNQ